MCNPTGIYADAYNIYTTYVTVTGNSQQNKVRSIFYRAEQLDIQLPAFFTQVHGGQTVSSSQQQNADRDRGTRAHAAYNILRGDVRAAEAMTIQNAPSPQPSTPQRSKLGNILKYNSTQQEQVERKKSANKTEVADRKKLDFLMQKWKKNAYSLSSEELKFLRDNGYPV